MIAQIRDKNRLRLPKEKGCKVDEEENEADDCIKTCDLIKKIHIDNPNDLIEKVCRSGNRLLVVSAASIGHFNM